MKLILQRPALLRTCVGALFLVAMFLGLAGCGPSNVKVTGTVVYQDKPLPGGRVTFYPAKGKQNPTAATFGEDGKFDVTLAVGDYTIAVDNQDVKEAPPTGTSSNPPGFKDPKMMGKPGGAKMPPKTFGPPPDILKKMKDEGKEPVTGPAGQKLSGTYVKIPEKYLRADESGLTQTIDANTKEIKIELK